MISHLLILSEFYGETENIEIAKGKNKLPETFSEALKQQKRKIIWRIKGK